jgi:hypothetical protein
VKKKKCINYCSENLNYRENRGVNWHVLMHEYNIGSAAIYDPETQKDELLDFADCSENSISSKGRSEC